MPHQTIIRLLFVLGFALAGTAASAIPPSITTPPSSQAVDAGASVTFTVAASGTTPFSYQWLYSSSGSGYSNILGQTSNSYTVGNASNSTAGYYEVQVSNVAGSVVSDPAVLAVNQAPVITVQPQAQTVALGANVTLSVSATGTGPLSYQWYFAPGGPDTPDQLYYPISGATAPTYTVNTASALIGYYQVVVSSAAGKAYSIPALVQVAQPPMLTTSLEGATVTVNTGQSLTLSVSAIGAGTLSYQWQQGSTLATLANIPGATNPTLVVNNIGANQGQYYNVIVTNSYGSTSSGAYCSVNTNARLTNLSARANVGGGNNILIAGFVMNGTAAKQIILRGVGPGLTTTFGLTGTLTTPELTLVNSSGSVLFTNTAWGGTAQLTSEFQQVGAFALQNNSADTALLETLGGGGVASYTSQISGVGGSTGIALAEIYDADTGTPVSQLTNISARANVGTGNNILIGGFVIGGTTSETVLIRAVGPGLATTFGLAGVLAQPVLTLYDSSQPQALVVASNTGWGNPIATGNSPLVTATGIQSATASIIASTGAYALTSGSADCAMVVTLPPGAYTAQVNGLSGATGIAVVEIYQVP